MGGPHSHHRCERPPSSPYRYPLPLVVLVEKRIRRPSAHPPQREPPIVPDPTDDVADLIEGTDDQRGRSAAAVDHHVPRTVATSIGNEALHRIERRLLEPGHRGHQGEALGQCRRARGLGRDRRSEEEKEQGESQWAPFQNVIPNRRQSRPAYHFIPTPTLRWNATFGTSAPPSITRTVALESVSLPSPVAKNGPWSLTCRPTAPSSDTPSR